MAAVGPQQTLIPPSQIFIAADCRRLKQFRRVASRYHKTARSFMAVIALAAVGVCLPSFIGTVQEP